MVAPNATAAPAKRPLLLDASGAAADGGCAARGGVLSAGVLSCGGGGGGGVLVACTRSGARRAARMVMLHLGAVAWGFGVQVLHVFKHVLGTTS